MASLQTPAFFSEKMCFRPDFIFAPDMTVIQSLFLLPDLGILLYFRLWVLEEPGSASDPCLYFQTRSGCAPDPQLSRLLPRLRIVSLEGESKEVASQESQEWQLYAMYIFMSNEIMDKKSFFNLPLRNLQNYAFAHILFLPPKSLKQFPRNKTILSIFYSKASAVWCWPSY